MPSATLGRSSSRLIARAMMVNQRVLSVRRHIAVSQGSVMLVSMINNLASVESSFETTKDKCYVARMFCLFHLS
jgi:hypothetical protein